MSAFLLELPLNVKYVNFPLLDYIYNCFNLGLRMILTIIFVIID